MKTFNNICGHNISIEDEVFDEFKKVKYREMDSDTVFYIHISGWTHAKKT